MTSLLAIATLYAGLAFAQPQATTGPKGMEPLPEVTYAALAESTTDSANKIVGRYHTPDFQPECVKTLDYFGALDERTEQLKELWKEIPVDKQDEKLNKLTAELNTALASANKVLRETYQERCGFCEGLSEQQCGDLDSYISTIGNVVKLGQIARSASAMSCEKTEDAYILVLNYIEQVRELEEHSQNSAKFLGEPGLVDLVRKTGHTETRKTFWQTIRSAESALEDRSRECK